MTRYARYGYRKVGGATPWSELKKTKVAGNDANELEKLEARRLARRLRKQKGKQCFNCRQVGHSVAECPEAKEEANAGICYKCGQKNHTTKNCRKVTSAEEGEYPFATCFVCKKKGHLTRSCPENDHGLYPNGGCCKLCGKVDHLRKDCPEARKKSGAVEAVAGVMNLKQSADDDDSHAMLLEESQDRKRMRAYKAQQKAGRGAAGSKPNQGKKVVSF